MIKEKGLKYHSLLEIKMILAFDIDGTLTESKQKIKPKMAELLEDLSYSFDLLFISGCSKNQMEEQVLKGISFGKAIYLLPCSGSQGYFGKGRTEMWNYSFSNKEFEEIENAYSSAVYKCGYDFNDSWGPISERRVSQLTFSLLGQEAPLFEKKRFDPDKSIRKVIAFYMQEMLPDFKVKIGGTTSIDVAKVGTKADGLYELLKYKPYYKKQSILFFGDALEEDGNDRSVLDEGFAVVKVNSPNDTYQYLQGM